MYLPFFEMSDRREFSEEVSTNCLQIAYKLPRRSLRAQRLGNNLSGVEARAFGVGGIKEGGSGVARIEELTGHRLITADLGLIGRPNTGAFGAVDGSSGPPQARRKACR